MKRTTLLFGLIVASGLTAFAGNYSVTSPDKQITINVETGKTLTWSVVRNGQTVIAPSAIGLDIEGVKEIFLDSSCHLEDEGIEMGYFFL